MSSSSADTSSHRRNGSRPEQQRVDFIYKSRFSNTLPDLPFDPKFLQSPFVDFKRFHDYKPTSLEKSYKYELLTEPDLNVKIDLIDPVTYYFDPNEQVKHHPKDLALLEDETVGAQTTKRSQQHSKIVPWMRKTEYISTEFNRYGVGADRQESKVGYNIKRKMGSENFYKDRQSQIDAINKTFEDAKKPVKKHYRKPGVHAVEEMFILPDFEMWQYPFAQVVFDADPLPFDKDETHKEKVMSNSLIRGMTDSEGKNFVGYFTPTDEALRQRDEDLEDGGLNFYKEAYAYEHTMEREYDWDVHHRGSGKGMTESFFFTLRNGAVHYNELETRVKLLRRKLTGTTKKSILHITHREPTDQEKRAADMRVKSLLTPFEEEVEEAEEEAVEEQPDAAKDSDAEEEAAEEKEPNEEREEEKESSSEADSDHEEEKAETQKQEEAKSSSSSSSSDDSD